MRPPPPPPPGQNLPPGQTAEQTLLRIEKVLDRMALALAQGTRGSTATAAATPREQRRAERAQKQQDNARTMDVLSTSAQAMSLIGALNAVSPALGKFGIIVATVNNTLKAYNDAMVPYVQAFDPSAVLLFQHAVRDAQAVLGTALSPVLRTTTEVVRTFADHMVPLANQLREPLTRLAAALTGLLQSAMGALAPALSWLADVLNAAVVPVLEAVVGQFRMYVVLISGIVGAIAQVFTAFFGLQNGIGNVASAMTTARDAVWSFQRALMVAAANLAQYFGLGRAIDGMIAALGGGRQKNLSFNIQAATNAQVTNAPAYSRSLATAAAMATMVPETMNKEDARWQELLKELKDIKNKKAWEALESLRQQVLEPARRAAPVVRAVREAAPNPALNPGAAPIWIALRALEGLLNQANPGPANQ